MAIPRHLSHTPITEAVIDFRVRTSPELDAKAFANITEAVGANYGPPKDVSLLEFGVRHSPGKQPESRQFDHGPIGSRYVSLDGKQIAQFRKTGFTFSRLAPYTRWEDMFAEAGRLYRIYVQTAQPEEVTRIAVRFINRLALPEQEVGDFSPFLTAVPPFPKDIPAVLTGFLTRVQVRDPQTMISGTVTQTIQQGSHEPGKIPVILDLDIYEAGSKSPDPGVVLPRFEALRVLKNRYFFASITEATADLYTREYNPNLRPLDV